MSTLTTLVIAGLDPAIQENKIKSLRPWITGSSPVMTSESVGQTNLKLP